MLNALFRSSKQKRFTLVEIIITLSLLLLVLAPMALVASMAIKDWQRTRNIRMLQEDLHLASFAIKGVAEEASDYILGADGNSIILQLKNGQQATIQQDGEKLLIGDRIMVTGLTGLEFEAYSSSSVWVHLAMELADHSQENTFVVKIRNTSE